MLSLCANYIFGGLWQHDSDIKIDQDLIPDTHWSALATTEANLPMSFSCFVATIKSFVSNLSLVQLVVGRNFFPPTVAWLQHSIVGNAMPGLILSHWD